MKKPIITFTDFSFQYHSQMEPTLKELNLTLYEGEKVLVVGPSGSGKSTFAHCINGLIPNLYKGQVSGTVTIAGKKLLDCSLFDLSFVTGTVLQDTDGQFVGLSVAEDIAFALENDAVPQPEMQAAVAKWAKRVAIDDRLDHRPQDLSGGQKQRVSMAGVLINEAPILLFDEPLANLDPRSGKEAIELIDELHQNTNTTVIIIEHRLEDVLERPVDRVILFHDGQILADLTPEELLKSTLLAENGIREPLYVTAMKYAGVDLNTLENIQSVHSVTGPKLKEQMAAWTSGLFDLPETPTAETLLEIKKLTFRYQKNQPAVLKDINTLLSKGERISVVGKNGAGKSTLCKAICGFIQGEGQLIWQGQEMNTATIKERADKIGYVMQNPNQMLSKKMIYDEVALGLVLRGWEPQQIKEKVMSVLKVCGLYPFRNWPIAALSYGQKKRVTIAAILVLEPEFLILDEPTAGQDFQHYTEMMLFIEELNRLGKTIFMITHDMHLMLEYTDRALVLADGKIITDTTPVNVLTNPRLVAQAALKETSLFTFASQLGLADPVSFTRKFIHYDREVRK